MTESGRRPFETEGDLLAIRHGVLVHQVNARGVMGAGLALQVRRRFPAAWEDYRRRFLGPGLSLGDVVLTRVAESGPWVASVVGQDGYGRSGCRTDYAALERGLREVASFAAEEGLPVFVPWGLGAGLAGGDWERVRDIVVRTLPGVTVVRLPQAPRRRR